MSPGPGPGPQREHDHCQFGDVECTYQENVGEGQGMLEICGEVACPHVPIVLPSVDTEGYSDLFESG